MKNNVIENACNLILRTNPVISLNRMRTLILVVVQLSMLHIIKLGFDKLTRSQ